MGVVVVVLVTEAERTQRAVMLLVVMLVAVACLLAVLTAWYWWYTSPRRRARVRHLDRRIDLNAGPVHDLSRPQGPDPYTNYDDPFRDQRSRHLS
jgi:TRAP-type C4-dicarboxylate transport system permease small subunit